MSNTETGKILIVVGILLFFIPFITIPFIILSGYGAFTCFPFVFVFAFIGIVLISIGGSMAGGSNIFGHHLWGQRIPPVQYPHQTQIKRERETIQEINCPNCGAPPRYTDHYGICMCEFCETKYKVR
jgi:hypothetical protein